MMHFPAVVPFCSPVNPLGIVEDAPEEVVDEDTEDAEGPVDGAIGCIGPSLFPKVSGMS